MSALEQSMKDFIAANGCVYFGITLHDYGHRLGFALCAQWKDEAKEHGHGVATGDGDTIAEAMAEMVAALAAKRATVLADEVLPMGEAA